MSVIETILLPVLQKELQTNSLMIQAIGGGSINETIKVSSPSKTFFVKVNTATKFPHLFEREAAGLLALEEQNILITPKVIKQIVHKSYQLLLLEWIESATPTPSFWKLFGEQLAQLHCVTHSAFGWKEDNYMGSIPQSNVMTNDWASFFIRQRLQTLVHLCHQKGLLSTKHVTLFTHLYKKVPDLFNEELPSLLHGDLWSGNFMCSINQKPVLIDPAVYFGHRSMDLGMTTLFGGFAPSFYEAYHYHYPLPTNHKEQWQLANSYPLLIHLILFGKTYLPSIERILNDFQ